MTATPQQQIVEQASADHSQYPQYEGHWDGPEWFLVRFTKRVRTKLGIAFEPGDVTICRAPQYRDQYDDHFTAYSLRNKIDTAVPTKSFERDPA